MLVVSLPVFSAVRVENATHDAAVLVCEADLVVIARHKEFDYLNALVDLKLLGPDLLHESVVSSAGAGDVTHNGDIFYGEGVTDGCQNVFNGDEVRASDPLAGLLFLLLAFEGSAASVEEELGRIGSGVHCLMLLHVSLDP